MKRMLPVEELARDDRFQRMRIEEAVFDPRNASDQARRTNGFAPDYPDSSDNARALMHGIFVGEIQALEGAGRTCCDFDTGDGPGQAPVRAQARHGPPVLGRGPPRGDLAASSPTTWAPRSASSPSRRMLYEAACNPDPVLRLTGVNRALEGLAIDVFNTMQDFGDACSDPVLYFCEDWMLADEVTHVKMGSDWLRRITVNDPERQKQALDFQRAVDKLFSFGGFRGEETENPVHLARKFRRLAGFSDDEISDLVDIAAEAYAEAQASAAERRARRPRAS